MPYWYGSILRPKKATCFCKLIAGTRRVRIDIIITTTSSVSCVFTSAIHLTIMTQCIGVVQKVQQFWEQIHIHAKPCTVSDSLEPQCEHILWWMDSHGLPNKDARVHTLNYFIALHRIVTHCFITLDKCFVPQLSKMHHISICIKN